MLNKVKNKKIFNRNSTHDVLFKKNNKLLKHLFYLINFTNTSLYISLIKIINFYEL